MQAVVEKRNVNVVQQTLETRRIRDEELLTLMTSDTMDKTTFERVASLTCSGDSFADLDNMVHVLGYAHNKCAAQLVDLKTTQKRLCGLMAALDHRIATLKKVVAMAPAERVFSGDHVLDGQETLQLAFERLEKRKTSLLKDYKIVQETAVRLVEAHMLVFASFQQAMGNTLHEDMIRGLML